MGWVSSLIWPTGGDIDRFDKGLDKGFDTGFVPLACALLAFELAAALFTCASVALRLCATS